MIYLKEGKIPLNFSYNDEIVHEGNSKYQLSFKFPTNNPLWKELEEETLLLADDLHGEQEFIIFEVEKHHAYITVYANQVATLLNNYSITEISVNNASGDRVMRSLTSSIIRNHKFTFSSDIANTHSFNLKNVTVANALFRDKHSIIGQWGGDLIRDKYDIRLLSNGGSNKEALFMYKKNLKSYQQKKSIKDLRTRIHFTKTINSQKEGEKDKVIAVTVDSPLINKYKNIYEGNLDVSDQDVIDEITLRKYGENYFKTTLCDVIEESIEIDVVGTPDEPVGIFDTVTIFHEKFNLDVKKKITKYTYSPMGRKLKTIGFGKIQSNLGTTLASMVDNAVAEQVESKLDVFKIQKNLDQLLKLDKKSIEDKLVELEEKSKSAVEVKKALFEADGEIPEIVKTRILDAVEGNIARLKTIITEAEMIKSIQAQLNFAEIKNAMIDKAFIKTLVSDESFRQQFEAGEVNTQNIFTKMRDAIQSSIRKDFITKEETKRLVNDLTISADGIRQIANEESIKTYESKKTELRGSDGKNAYVFKKYSNFADGREMNDNPNSTYLGLYTGTSKTAPTDYTQYSWTKIKGEDGARGQEGPRGQDGRDGKPVFFHTAYANSQDGRTDFSTTNNINKSYIGTYSDNVQADSIDPTKYKWVKVKGDNGRDGQDGATPNYLPNSNFEHDLDGWDSNKFNNSGLEYQKKHAIIHFGRGLHIYGTPNGEYKGLSSDPFMLDAKTGDNITVSMDLGKDALNNYSTLRIGLHYLDKSGVILSQHWRDLNLESQNFTVKEYKRISLTFNSNVNCSKCRLMIYALNGQLSNFYIDKIKVEKSSVATPWMPSLEDLKAHSLSANVRIAGTYEGKKANNIKFYVDVYYDGEKITNGFNLTARVWGGGLNKTQENATYNNDGELTNVYYSNGEKDGTTINIKLDVEYKYLKTTCFARLDNLPDTELVKEITSKYKTFDTTLEQFRSQIGELNDKQFKVAIRGDNLLNSAEKKTGNNLTYTTLEPMKPGNTYTLVADFRYFPANQELRIFNSERQRLVAGINMFTFTVPTETRTINLTPLGNDTEVKNVEVWEGNYNEGLEDNSFDIVSGGARSFVAIKLKNEFKEGRYYKMVFDTTAPNNSVIAVDFTEFVFTFNGGKVIPHTNYKPMTAKDNVLFTRISEKSPNNKDFVYLEFSGDFDKSQITNVRFYEINLGFRYTKRNETVDIASLINQSKEEITLKLSKTLATDYMTKTQTETSIKLLRDKIENVVTDENFGTTLVQNAKSLKLAWNNYTKYFQFEDESLILYEGKAESAKKRVKLDYLGTSYYDQNGEFSGAIRGYYKTDVWGANAGYYSGMNFVIKANGRVGWFEETEEWGLKLERPLLAFNYIHDDNHNELKNTIVSYVDFEAREKAIIKGDLFVRGVMEDGGKSVNLQGRDVNVKVQGLNLKFRNGILVS